MTLKFTILGCGSSMGVPRVSLGWGDCDPNEPKNRRRRCALLVEQTGSDGSTRVLVDCGPDMRNQLLDANVDWVDAVLVTHEHADHVHGIDDLRPMFIHKRRRIDMWMDEATSRALRPRFGYCFETPIDSNYPPILQEHRLVPGTPVTINGQGGPLQVLPFQQDHGDVASLGFRFGNVAYSTDLKRLPHDSIAMLDGLDIWIVDALRRTPHPSHMHLPETLEWVARIKPKLAILTDMHTDMDYQRLKAELPHDIIPAFDGMSFESAAA